MSLKVIKIVSGGQTGADRAGLDWAISRKIPHSGWCPKGRKAEDGVIPERYRLQETRQKSYRYRTEANVLNSDGTVIFTTADKLSEGSATTANTAARMGRPCLHLSAKLPTKRAIDLMKAFILGNRIKVLNIAGPRASKDPTVARFVKRVLNGANLTPKPTGARPMPAGAGRRRGNGVMR